MSPIGYVTSAVAAAAGLGALFTSPAWKGKITAFFNMTGPEKLEQLQCFALYILLLLRYLVFLAPLILVSFGSGWALRIALSKVFTNPGNYVWLWIPSLWSAYHAYKVTRLGIIYLSTNLWRAYQLVLTGVGIPGIASLAIILKSSRTKPVIWIAYLFVTIAFSLHAVHLVGSEVPLAQLMMGSKVRGWMVHAFENIKADSPGRSEWFGQRVEWMLCFVIWTITPMWLFFYGYFCSSDEMKHDRQMAENCGEDCCVVNPVWYYVTSWLPIFLIIPAYIMFLGFVSYTPSIYDAIQYIMNFACLIFFRYAGGVTAYLLGCFSASIFLLPVIVADEAHLAKYDYKAYTLGVGWTTGISNGICAIAYYEGYISEPLRWKIQTVGWTLVMSGSVIVTAIMGQSASYTLTVGETLRYSAFQLAVYTFIYFGICRTMEEAFDELGWL